MPADEKGSAEPGLKSKAGQGFIRFGLHLCRLLRRSYHRRTQLFAAPVTGLRRTFFSRPIFPHTYSGSIPQKPRNQDSPEYGRPLRVRDPFIFPSQVQPAVAAEGHAPGISLKPGVLQGVLPACDCAGAGQEGVKVAFKADRVYKQMTACAADGKQPVGPGDCRSAPGTQEGLALLYSRHLARLEEDNHN